MKKRVFIFLTTTMIFLSGCANSKAAPERQEHASEDVSVNTEQIETEPESTENPIAQEEKTTESAEKPTYADEASDMFTNRDYEVGYDETDSIEIILSGDTAVCDSETVKLSGGIITITDEGTYILKGTLNNGMIIVDADEDDKLQIVLDGASVASSSSAALYVRNAKKVFVTIEEDTENFLSNGGSFEAIDENNIDAAVFAKQDITFNGSGTLEISSPAGHGISGKDDLTFTSGKYNIISGSHGIDANNSIRLANAEITIESGKDGVHSENSDDTSLGFVYALSGTYNINASGDGVSAGSYIQIEKGSYDITSGGGSINAEEKAPNMGMMGGRPPHMYGAVSLSSADPYYNSTTGDENDTSVSTKGMKAVGDILLNGGEITIDSADDSVHSDASFTMNNGTLKIKSGDDGIHANETLTINEGCIEICESYEGVEALDIVIDGGDLTLTASDDGFNAAGGNDSSGFGGFGGRNDMFGGGHGGMGGNASNGSVIITGGNIYINASGDGIDSNGSLEISGGSVTVCGPTIGDTAVLDYDTTGIITGGTFIGTGSYMMAQTFSSSEQGVIAVNVGEQSAGTLITVEDKNENVIISEEPILSFQIIIISSPDIKTGETYILTVGEETAEFEAN